jgi:hypothetical protein
VVGAFDADLALVSNQLLELVSGVQVRFVELGVAAAAAILDVRDDAILVFDTRSVRKRGFGKQARGFTVFING